MPTSPSSYTNKKKGSKGTRKSSSTSGGKKAGQVKTQKLSM